MGIGRLPQTWRLNGQRYQLTGEIHNEDCRQPHFPPRDVCPLHETPLDRELKDLRQFKANDKERFEPLTKETKEQFSGGRGKERG